MELNANAKSLAHQRKPNKNNQSNGGVEFQPTWTGQGSNKGRNGRRLIHGLGTTINVEPAERLDPTASLYSEASVLELVWVLILFFRYASVVGFVLPADVAMLGASAAQDPQLADIRLIVKAYINESEAGEASAVLPTEAQRAPIPTPATLVPELPPSAAASIIASTVRNKLEPKGSLQVATVALIAKSAEITFFSLIAQHSAVRRARVAKHVAQMTVRDRSFRSRSIKRHSTAPVPIQVKNPLPLIQVDRAMVPQCFGPSSVGATPVRKPGPVHAPAAAVASSTRAATSTSKRTCAFMLRVVPLWALCGLSWAQQTHDLIVHRVDDGTSNAADCFPVASANAQCNLRSAWEACASLPATDTCNIHLPASASIPIANGTLFLTAGKNVHVLGNGATVLRQAMLFDVVPTVTLSGTNFALENYAELCINACPGDEFKIAACNGDTTDDAYFRLFLDDAQVAENYRSCGTPWTISYTYLGAACTNTLCLHIGCYANAACSANVEIYRLQSPSRFVQYGNTDALSSTTPRFALSNLTVTGFGDPGVDGGAVYLDGSVQASFDNVKFIKNTGRYGAAVYVANNAVGVSFTHILFQECISQSGGAVSLFKDTANVVISDSAFTSNEVTSGSGGGLHLGTNNMHVHVNSTKFSACNAITGNGGAVGVGVNNSHLSFTNIFVDQCGAGGGGGGLGFDTANSQIAITNSHFERNAAGAGGAIFMGDSNAFVTISGSVFSDNNAVDTTRGGGCLYMGNDNDNFTLTDSTFTNCVSSGFGGGLFVNNENRHMEIRNTLLTSCTAVYMGGGMMFSLQNTITLYSSQFASCMAEFAGGGIHADSYNNLTVQDSSFVQCASQNNNPTQSGGGGLSAQSQNNLVIKNTVFDSCTSMLQGGGVRLYSHNGLTMSSTRFVSCASDNEGGGVYLGNDNVDVKLSDVTFRRCSANTGGAIHVNLNNLRLQIVNSTIEWCSAISSGGGLYFGTKNDHALIQNCVYKKCWAKMGGTIFASGSTNLQLVHVNFTHNTATDSGGAMYLDVKNNGVTVSECAFTHNYAAEFGGAIFSSTTTTELTIAGCLLDSNNAGASGGALAVEGGNRNLLITDTATAALSFVSETSHPYWYDPVNADQYGYYVFRQAIDETQAAEFMIHFDPLTDFSTKDRIVVEQLDGTRRTWSSGDKLPGVQLSRVRVPATFSIGLYNDGVTTAYTDNLFGFKLYATAIPRVLGTPTVFSNNHAGERGGAVYMFSSVEYATVTNTRFEHNKASAGGAMLLRSGINRFYMESCVFTENESSGDGGALVVSSATYGLTLKDCDFNGNIAASNGGAISLVTDNGKGGIAEESKQVTISGCDFESNIADYGGAIHADRENDMIIDHCTVHGNTARVNGGGLLLATQNVVTLSSSDFIANVAAESGGGIAALLGNTMTLHDVALRENTAGISGGGMHCANDTAVAVTGQAYLHRNVAGQAGGAISSLFATPWTIDGVYGSVHLVENSARRGSALYYRGLQITPTPGTSAFYNYFIERNVASVGGTVYWLCDSTMPKDPFASSASDAWWTDNTAPYGEMFATQAVQVLGPQKYTATVYGAALSPPLSFALYDYYGQEVPIDGSTTVVASIVGADATQCNSRFPFLTGAGAEEYVQSGVAGFDGLVVQCAPKGAITLNFEARLADHAEIDDGTLSSYYISNRTEMTFRSCKAGEFIKDGQCTTCPIGTFSLESTVTDDTECHDGTKFSGFKTCYSDQIITKKDYWRRYPASVSVLACSNDLSGCQGGNGTGDSLCLEGHEGPLCAVCSDGYYRDGQLCSTCENQGNIRPVTAFYLAIAACAVVVAAFFFYTNCLDPTLDDEPAQTDHGMAELVNVAESELTGDRKNDQPRNAAADIAVDPAHSFQARVRVWFQKLYDVIKTKMKIMITTYQIVSSIPTTTAVKFPRAFSKFLGAFDVFNLNVVSTVPLGCTGTYTFIDKLVFTTLFPIALALLLLLFLVCEVIVQVRTPFRLNGNERKTKLLMALKDKYLTYFFFLTYLVLPSVATTIFQTFLCTNVDPSGEDSDTSDYYLTADMSISCTSDYYHRGVAYAVVMLLIYVVGIPLMYFVLLYYNRIELMTRQEAPLSVGADNSIETLGVKGEEPPIIERSRSSKTAKNATPRVLSDQAARLSFLWDAYEPKFWYWEVVETTRRLMLTAVLSVCSAGTSAQAIFAILLALLYIKMYGFFAPYEESRDDILAETGQFQIFFSFLGALIYQKSLLGSSWNTGVSVALILINLAVSLIVAYFELGGLVEQVQEYFYDHRRTPGSAGDGTVDAVPGEKSSHTFSIDASDGSESDSLDQRMPSVLFAAKPCIGLSAIYPDITHGVAPEDYPEPEHHQLEFERSYEHQMVL